MNEGSLLGYCLKWVSITNTLAYYSTIKIFRNKDREEEGQRENGEERQRQKRTDKDRKEQRQRQKRTETKT